MKAKKFLKVMRSICNNENCLGNCPMIVNKCSKNGREYSECALDPETLDKLTDEQIENIVNQVKMWR